MNRQLKLLALIIGVTLGFSAVASATLPAPRFLGEFGTNGTGNLEFDSPRFIALRSSDGALAIADFLNDRVQLVNNGVYTDEVGGTGTQEGQMSGPSGVAFDSQGNLYVAETSNNRISKFDSNGDFVVMWGFGVQSGAPSFQTCTQMCQNGTSGSGAGQLDVPWGIGVDASDNIYVADSGNDRINIYTSAGAVVGSFGTSGTGDGQLDTPHDIVLDSSGSRYVVDRGNHRVQKFDNTNAYVSQWGGFGTGKGQLYGPSAITIDDGGHLHVAEDTNARVSRFDTNGTFELMFGFGVVTPMGGFEVCRSTDLTCRAGELGTGDGQFTNPQGIVADPLGNVFVTDDNDRVQKLGPGFFVLDGYGGVHAGGGAADMTPATYFGFDIARDLLLGKRVGFYVLDGYGGLHAGGGESSPASPQTTYFGFDAAKDLEHDPVLFTGRYVLDVYGGVHAGGGASVISPATPYFGFDVARDLEMTSTGYYVLDAFGGVHRGGGAPALSPSPTYFGFDVSSAMEVASVGGVYILDKWGGIHVGGGAPVLSPSTPYFGFDVARDIELAPFEMGFYVLDGYGGIHAGGNAASVTPSTTYFGFDIARDLEIG